MFLPAQQEVQKNSHGLRRNLSQGWGWMEIAKTGNSNKRSSVPVWVRDGSKMLQKWVPGHAWILYAFPRRQWIWFSGRGSALVFVFHSLLHWYFQKQLRTMHDFRWDFKLSLLPHYKDLSPAKTSSSCRKWGSASLFLSCMYCKMCVTASYHHPASRDRPHSAQSSEKSDPYSCSFFGHKSYSHKYMKLI